MLAVRAARPATIRQTDRTRIKCDNPTSGDGAAVSTWLRRRFENPAKMPFARPPGRFTAGEQPSYGGFAQEIFLPQLYTLTSVVAHFTTYPSP